MTVVSLLLVVVAAVLVGVAWRVQVTGYALAAIGASILAAVLLFVPRRAPRDVWRDDDQDRSGESSV